MNRFFLRFLFIGIVVGALTRIACAEATSEPLLLQMLSWLPSDTETVTVARGPFEFARPPEEHWTAQTWDPNREVPGERANV